eukprot:244174_1
MGPLFVMILLLTPSICQPPNNHALIRAKIHNMLDGLKEYHQIEGVPEVLGRPRRNAIHPGLQIEGLPNLALLRQIHKDQINKLNTQEQGEISGNNNNNNNNNDAEDVIAPDEFIIEGETGETGETAGGPKGN